MPGLLLSATIALAVRFVSERLGGPAMLYALLFGMAFNFLTEDERFATGIRIASRNILRFGVALLGLRITMTEVADLGWPVLALIVASVLATIILGGLVGRAFGLGDNQSVLSAGAVAICGASAALAISSVLPAHKDLERNTILTVAGVTALSTIAMVIYPVFVTYLHYDHATAGVFLGATIHDVAQVVGAREVEPAVYLERDRDVRDGLAVRFAEPGRHLGPGQLLTRYPDRATDVLVAGLEDAVRAAADVFRRDARQLRIAHRQGEPEVAILIRPRAHAAHAVMTR